GVRGLAATPFIVSIALKFAIVLLKVPSPAPAAECCKTQLVNSRCTHSCSNANTGCYELVPDDDTPGNPVDQLGINLRLWITCGLLCTGCAQAVDQGWNTYA